MQAAFALARYDGVHGQRQRIEPGVLGRLDQRDVQPAVLVDIQLEQLGAGDALPDFGKADGGERGDAEEGVELLRRCADRLFTAPVEQALQRGG